MHDLKDLLCAELDEYTEKGRTSGKMSASDLDTIHKLTDTVKNIMKIDRLEGETGYSGDGRYMGEGRIYGTSYDMGSSYARKRDSMGRYSRDMRTDDGYSDARRHYVRGHYSRDDGKQYMMERLDEMMERAEKPAEREALERCMKALERA